MPGAESIGLNITLPHEQYPNPYVTPELCFSFHYFAMRKLHFLMRARALVAFPGGYGTMDELFEVLTLVQTRKIEPVPVILVGEDYWRRVFDADFLVAEGTIDPEDRELFWYAETAAGHLARHPVAGTRARRAAAAAGHDRRNLRPCRQREAAHEAVLPRRRPRASPAPATCWNAAAGASWSIAA